MSDSVTPWTAACLASLYFTISWSFLKLMSIESVMPSNHLILCCPLLLLPSIFPSIKVFSNESALRIKWPKYWSFCFSLEPFINFLKCIFFYYFWLHWVFLAVLRLSLGTMCRAYLSLLYPGFSVWWLLLSLSTGLRVRLSSCSSWASLANSMWDLSGPGVNPVSSALAGGFFANGPLEKPGHHLYYLI